VSALGVKDMATELLFVTVECDAAKQDAALPSDVPIASLVPQLLKMLGLHSASERDDVSRWVLTADDGEVLPGNFTLAKAGVEEGHVIRLRDRSSASPPSPSQVNSPAAQSVTVTHRVALPEASHLDARLRAVAHAVVSAGVDTPRRLAIPRSRSVLERAEAAWRSSDYRHQLDEAISAQRLTSPVTIAVISPKGGVGKTTTAALLGTLLAMVRSDRVVAVDCNPDYGTLGLLLTPGHDIFVDDLVGVVHQPALTVTMLERFLGRAEHGLMVLPAPTDPERMERLDEGAYQRVINRLQELAGIVLLDCGAGINDPITRVAVASADQLVLVSDADPTTATLVLQAGVRLAEGKSLTYVVNKQPRSGSQLNMERLAEDARSARGLIQIEADAAAASRVSRGEFNWRDAPDNWQVAFRELAAILATDWATLGLTD
jgi:MinD-like ATPase involved in chromosome partitioning or flagellar assembly